MRRSHVHLPLTDNSGNLLIYATVTVLDGASGRQVTDPLYSENSDVAVPVGNPMVISPGIFDVWCDQPRRVDLIVDGPDGFQTTLRGVDITPDPLDVTRAPDLTQINNSAEGDRVLIFGGSGRASWSYPTVIPPHDHDGTKSGSTMVDPGDTVTDASPSQTWIGYQSGAGAADQTGSTSLGAGTEPAGRYVTTLGAGASARTVGGVAPYAGTSLGSDSYATSESVAVGNQAGRDAQKSVGLSKDGDGQQRRYVEPHDTFLRNVHITDGASSLGSAQAVPTTPAGVTQPLWLRQDAVAPGPLRATGSVTIGSVASLLGFFDQSMVGKQSLPRDTNIPALASLLTVLESYGLTTLTDATTQEVVIGGQPRFEVGGTAVGGSTGSYTDSNATWTWYGSAPYLDVADQGTNYGERVENASSGSAGSMRWIAWYLDAWTPPAGKTVVDARLEIEAWSQAGAFVWGLNDPVNDVYLGGNPDTTFPSGTWTKKVAGKANPADPYGPYALYAPGQPGYELADLVRALASGQAFIEATSQGNADGTGKTVRVSQLRLVLTLA